MDKISHSDLIMVGAKWLKNTKMNIHFKSQFVVTEFVTQASESPDIFGLRGGNNILIEVKTSRVDFLNDKKKYARQEGKGIGALRYYLCQPELIKESDLPDKWGLLYCDDQNKIEVIKMAKLFENKNNYAELCVLLSVIRRLAGKPQIFNFRTQ